MSKVAQATAQKRMKWKSRFFYGWGLLVWVPLVFAISAFFLRSHQIEEILLSPQLKINTVAQESKTETATASDSDNAQSATFPDGEPRQRPEFEKIAAALYEKSQFFEQGKSDRIRNELTKPKIGKGQQILKLRQLALSLLEEGRAKESTETVDQLMEVLKDVPAILERNPQIFAVHALSYLRLSEVENCISRHNAECCLFPLAGGGVHTVKDPANTARQSYLEYLERRPNDYAVKWLLNLTAMAIGDHPQGISADHVIPTEAFASEYDVGRFPDIASKLGIDTFNLCGGCIVDDFDGDNFLDIATSTIDPEGPIHFYHNRGDGSFEDRSENSRLNDQLGGLNIVPGDYDNDGDLDIFVLRGAWLYEDGRIRNSLLRNDGKGVFTDVTRRAGVAEPASPTQAAVWGDFDNDGDLDLFVGNESRSDKSMVPPSQRIGGDYPSQLFSNNGDGTFTDIAEQAGVTNDRYAKGVTAGDYNNDGHLDLYISNYGQNRLYHNNGDGTFTDVAEDLEVQEPSYVSFATWFLDYNNDGWLDLFVTAYDTTIADLGAYYLDESYDATPPRLYRNRGDAENPGFDDVTEEVGLSRPMRPMGANFGDLDNDGFLDLYLTTGEPSYEALMPNVMLRNDRGQRFQDVSTSGGFGHLQKGHGIAFADIDQDGDQDLYHQLGGFYEGDAYANALFQNPGHGNHFLTVKLQGTQSVRCGYGARVSVQFDTPEGSSEVHRSVGSVSSFGGSPRRQEIGLGKAETITELKIEWPASKTVQVFTEVSLDSMVEIVEGNDELKIVPMNRFEF